jgi:PucR family transcriptional regulator, purine catabolism regulatory protein
LKLTLDNLLTQPDLDLTLVTGSEQACERVIEGAHSIEVAAPSRWLPSDWIMLTTGLRVRGRPDEQRSLVAELHQNGQAALGWAVGLVVQNVPQAVLEEAEARDFPVFRVPIEIPFRDIISFVNGARLSEDLYVMRRIMAMQKFLMDALHRDDPSAAIVDRLAAMLEADVLLFGTDGSTVRQCGNTNAAEVVDDVLEARGATLVEGEVRGRRLLGLSVATERGCEGWLAAVLPRGTFAERLGKPVLRSAAQLLGLVAHVRHLGKGDERERRTEVLLASLDGLNGDQAIALDHKARALGVDFSSPARVVVWAPADGVADGLPPRLLDECVHAVEAALAAAKAHFLVAPLEDRIAGIVQRDGDIGSELLAEHVQTLGLRAGVGRAIRNLGDAAQSLVDAQLALAHAYDCGEAVATFDHLDPASWLLASCDQDVVSQKVMNLLTPLDGQEPLLATLRTYFAVDMNVAEAARRLNVHRNTLRYRLARIEELLDLRLDSPHAIANLHIALLTQRLAAGGSQADPRRTGAGGNGSSARSPRLAV